MATDIGAKLKVTGESQYTKAMREAAKNTKSLDQELKLAEERFKATGDAQALMEEKSKILNEQLQQQEKAVQAAQEYLSKLKSAGYDANSTAVMTWRGKLAQAQSQVLQTTQAIEQNATALDDMTGAGDDARDSMADLQAQSAELQSSFASTEGLAAQLRGSLGGIGESVGWGGIKDTLHGINSAIDATIKRAAELAKSLWDSTVDASVWADTVATESSKLSLDPTTYQQWVYASRFIDTSVSTIAGAQKRLKSDLAKTGSAGADFAADMAQIGVATHTSAGQLRSANDVFWDTLDYLSRIDDQAKRDIEANRLLGKSAADLNPLIEAGRSAWEAMAESAPVIDGKAFDDLATANDSIENMNAQLEALKLDVFATFAPLVTEVSTALADAAKSLREFLDTEEGQELIEQLQSSMHNLVKDFTEADLGGTLQDAAKNVADLVGGFLDFVGDEERIKGALIAVGATIAGLKLAEVGATVAELAANLKIIRGGGAIASGAASAAGAAGGAVTIPNVIFNGATFAGAAFVGATIAASMAIDSGAVSQVNERMAQADEMTDLARSVETTTDSLDGLADALQILKDLVGGDLESYGPLAFGGAELFEQMPLDKILQIAPNSQLAGQLGYYGSLDKWLHSGEPVGTQAEMYARELIDSISEYIEQESAKVGDAVSAVTTDAIEAGDKALGDSPEIMGGNISIGIANGIMENRDAVQNAMSAIAEDIQAGITVPMQIESPSRLMQQYGRYITEGLGIGVQDGTSEVQDAVGAAMKDIRDLLAMPVQIENPLKALQQYGRYIAEGLGIGVQDGAPGVRDSVHEMARAVVPEIAIPADTPRAIPQADRISADGLYRALSRIQVQIDGQDAGSILLPTIENLMSDQAYSRRYA